MELDIHDPNYTEKLLTESKKYKSKSRPVGPVQSDAIYDDGKFRNCAWVTGKLNEQDAEIARLNEKVTRTVIGHNDCANELIGTREENEQLKAQLEKARKHLTDIKQPGDLVPQIEKAIAVLEIGG